MMVLCFVLLRRTVAGPGTIEQDNKIINTQTVRPFPGRRVGRLKAVST